MSPSELRLESGLETVFAETCAAMIHTPGHARGLLSNCSQIGLVLQRAPVYKVPAACATHWIEN